MDSIVFKAVAYVLVESIYHYRLNYGQSIIVSPWRVLYAGKPQGSVKFCLFFIFRSLDYYAGMENVVNDCIAMAEDWSEKDLTSPKYGTIQNWKNSKIYRRRLLVYVIRLDMPL